MPTFEVVVERTVWVSLEFEGQYTKEQVETLAREQIDSEFGDIREWQDYKPLELEYDVIQGD